MQIKHPTIIVIEISFEVKKREKKRLIKAITSLSKGLSLKGKNEPKTRINKTEKHEEM